MSIFTIFNPTTKHIAEETFFEHWHAAEKYRKENYSDDYICKHEPFHFSSDLKKMLKEGHHPRIKLNRWKEKAAIISEDGSTIFHCGGITLQEWVNLGASGIKSTQISKTEFINLHNSLI